MALRPPPPWPPPTRRCWGSQRGPVAADVRAAGAGSGGAGGAGPPPPARRPRPRGASPAHISTPGAVDEALGLLLVERQSRNSPELQRLLSVAYEAQSNRLRALGHMHLAVQLAGTSTEGPKSQLALAQLLARMGHAPQ